MDPVIPRMPAWARALPSKQLPSFRMPQIIAHRGSHVAYPENSLLAFKHAVQVGAHAAETDLNLTADGEVVLSHDPTLKRCFGLNKAIAKCTWEELSTLKTLREPHVPMLRFRDLLEYLTDPDVSPQFWLLLDVHPQGKSDILMHAIAKVLEQVKGPVPWDQRIVLSLWNVDFLEAAQRLLPSYHKTLTTFTLLHTQHVCSRVPNIGLSFPYELLKGFLGYRILRQWQAEDRAVLVWTASTEKSLNWCIKKNGIPYWTADRRGGPALIDGVITDDPNLFHKVQRRWEEGLAEMARKRKALDDVAAEDEKHRKAHVEEYEQELSRKRAEFSKQQRLTAYELLRIVLYTIFLTLVFFHNMYISGAFQYVRKGSPLLYRR